MVDLTKPCVKCGAVDRYKTGECKRCNSNRKRIWACLKKPCGKCGAVDRYENGVCKACSRKRKRSYPDQTTPCVKCRGVDRYPSGNCKECDRNRRRNYMKTKSYLQNKKMQYYKAKKLNFEFSLQNQQKVIEQCQQKKISGKEM